MKKLLRFSISRKGRSSGNGSTPGPGYTVKSADSEPTATGFARLKDEFLELAELPANEREGRLRRIGAVDPAREAHLRDMLANRTLGWLDEPIPLPRGLHVPTETDFHPGAVLCDRFRLEKLLGEGGMGEVWEAFDGDLREWVALKMIRSCIANDHLVVDQFKQEVGRARAIASRHVCRVHDLFFHQQDGRKTWFLTMQKLNGETLAERLARGPLSDGEALPVIEGVAEGLACAHRKEIVHGDLKTNNIMLCPNSSGSVDAVITDFGLARRAGAVDQPALGGGTPRYMAPEQKRGSPATAASDIYSFGLVAYEMVMGHLPGEARGKQRKPPARGWWGVIMRCLEPDPARRYQSAIEVMSALARAAMTRRLVIGGAVAAVAGFAATQFLPTKPAPPKSIVVIPFEQIGTRPEDASLGDGFTEEMANALGRIPGLKVMGTGSSFRLKKLKLSPVEISRQLGVRYLLSGSVRRDQGRIVLIGRLVEGSTGFQVFSQDYDRRENELPRLRDLLAKRVADALQMNAAAAMGGDTLLSPSAVKASDEYWIGRLQLRKRTDEGVRLALAAFEKAIEHDPGYGPAHSGLADAYCIAAERGIVAPIEAFPKAKAAANVAVSLMPYSAEAQVSLAQITSMYDGDQKKAVEQFRQALELEPNHSGAHQWFSYLLGKLRRFDEATQHAREAVEKDRLSLPASINLALQYYYAGKDEQAIEQTRKLLATEPGFLIGRLLLVNLHARRGRAAEAIREFEQIPAAGRATPTALRFEVEFNSLLGRKQDAARALSALLAARGRREAPASFVAIAYAAVGDRDAAFEWLDTACAEYDGFVSMMHAYPAFDSIRADARYRGVLARLGITSETARGLAAAR